MRNINLVRLAGVTTVAVLGLGACGEAAQEDEIPKDNPPAAAPTVAQPEEYPNDCGIRLPRPDSPVRC
jgi:hypothetical protein